jgi:hypothetical protein
MWNGSWDAAGTVYTGNYTAADRSVWVGTVTVVDPAGIYTWAGAWHFPGPPV